MKWFTTLTFLSIAVFINSLTCQGQVTVEQNFEGFENFSLDFSPWKVVDVDQSPTYSVVGYDFLHAGDTMAFIVFNPLSTNPAWSVQAIQPHSGSKFAACFADHTPPNNDWLISPRVVLGTGSYVTFWVKSYTDDYGLEKYRVAISTTGNDPGDFQVISGPDPLVAPVDMWQQKNFDLSAFDGHAVYFAIQCVSNEAFIFMVDDIVINTNVGIEEFIPAALSVTPNPARDLVQFQFTGIMKEILICDLFGHVMKDIRINGSSYETDVSGLASGVYLYKVISGDDVFTGKVFIK